MPDERGVRDIVHWKGRQSYVIVAVPFGENTRGETYRLYRVGGQTGQLARSDEERQTCRDEFPVVIRHAESGSKLIAVSGDGKEPTCAEADPGFRSVSVALP